MRRHDTPTDIAEELAKHAPRRLRTILDPAAGSGALLLPIAEFLRRQDAKVYCVDSDKQAVADLQSIAQQSFPASTQIIHADFLAWSQHKHVPKFDCIVMNPPFAAGTSQLCRIRLPECLSRSSRQDRCVPLEAAFVIRAMSMLNDDGRLLAILPCSVAMSESSQWLRDLLLHNGAIRFVHELSPRCFPNVESRMYLLVFDRSASQRKVVFFNHDLTEPERLDVWLRKDKKLTRLDFGFHQATLLLDKLCRRERFAWQSLMDVATVVRGDIESPAGPEYAVHTSDFWNGFWRRSVRHDRTKRRDVERTIRRGDVLVARVGRSCHKTFGRPIALHGMPCSDCVFILRPRKVNTSTELLFALRVLFEIEWAKPLIERGTGASYMSRASLRDMRIPTKMSRCYPNIYSSFVAAQRSRSPRVSQSAVRNAAWRFTQLIE